MSYQGKQDILKDIFVRHLEETFARYIEDILLIYLEDALKLSEDIL